MLKRSEFYSMMAVLFVFMLFSVASAVSYQPQIIQPTKPYYAGYSQTTASTDTYYTILDTVSGSGCLNYVVMAAPVNAISNQMKIKITIDGTAYELTDAYSNLAAGVCISNGTSVFATNKSLAFYGPLYFKTSIKVEIKQTSGGDDSIRGAVSYALE